MYDSKKVGVEPWQHCALRSLQSDSAENTRGTLSGPIFRSMLRAKEFLAQKQKLHYLALHYILYTLLEIDGAFLPAL